ncbi:MAG: glycosyltransferase family 2 protein [Gemmatimonadaceae bacterium]
MTYSLPPAAVTLSIIIPCFNEGHRIDATLDAVEALRLPLAAAGMVGEVVAVDDGSADDTFERLTERAARYGMSLIPLRHAANLGKGAAVRTAREHVTGAVVVFQDADLELDPAEIVYVIAPLLDGRADAVLGSRFLRTGEHRVVNFWHRQGNKILTYVSNMFTGLDLTDMETGFKAFTIRTFRALRLTSDRFGMEPEIVARLAQMRARVYEVPVTYEGRSYLDGKKITWRDGIAAFAHIWRAHRSGRSQPLLQPGGRRTPVGVPAYRAVDDAVPTSGAPRLAGVAKIGASFAEVALADIVAGAHTEPSAKRAIRRSDRARASESGDTM